MSRLDDIIAYTFQADTYCARCILGKGNFSVEVVNVPHLEGIALAETVLNVVALSQGVNREDEYSFDSDDFPKILFRDQLEPDEDGNSERCGGCSCVLEEVW